jgi:hypothetical protein
MEGNRLRDAFCTLFLMVTLWNLTHRIFNLNGDGWQQATLTVNSYSDLVRIR